MEILVLAPYEAKLLKAVSSAKKINLGIFTIIGNKKTIYEVCFRNKIDCHEFEIIDCAEEKDIIDFTKKYLLKDIAYVIIGNISYYYQKKLYSVKEKDDFNYINIIDFPLINHFHFVSNFSHKEHVDFEDKKKAIIKAYSFMNKLGIKRANAALVTSIKTKAEILESNIIKMILKDCNYKTINILDSYKLYDLFEQNSLVNVYKNNINLLIFKTFESSNTFLETLNVLGTCKIASIMTYNNFYLIDSNDIKNEHNIIFSMLVLLKVLKNEEILISNN